MEKHLVIITGPTASGKSGLSVQLAKKYSGEIISADSMQVYRKMDIGTAKSTIKEMNNIPHHLIDILEPEEEFSVAEYVRLATKCIDEIHSRKKIPFLVGGTTLYIQSIINNVQFFEIPKDEELRKNLLSVANRQGNQALWDKLNLLDPILAKDLHYNNIGRVIRGIETFETTGKPLSYWQKLSLNVPTPYNISSLGLTYQNREILYNNINSRVDKMMKAGLLEEIKFLHKKDCSKTAKQAIGYKELWNVIEGTESLEVGIDQLKLNTRHYAKRQLTWMRGQKKLNWIYRDVEEAFESAVKLMDDFLKD